MIDNHDTVCTLPHKGTYMAGEKVIKSASETGLYTNT